VEELSKIWENCERKVRTSHKTNKRLVWEGMVPTGRPTQEFREHWERRRSRRFCLWCSPSEQGV